MLDTYSRIETLGELVSTAAELGGEYWDKEMKKLSEEIVEYLDRLRGKMKALSRELSSIGERDGFPGTPSDLVDRLSIEAKRMSRQKAENQAGKS